MIRFKRFKHQYKRIRGLFIAALVVIIAYIFLKQKVEDCYYITQIFSVLYNLSLAVIASIIFFFILNFWEEDIIKEKYEKRIVGYLKQINYTMKEIVYVIIEEDHWAYIASFQECEKIIEDIDIEGVKEVFREKGENSGKQKSLSETRNTAEYIAECENYINQKVDIIMNLYGNFIAKEDIDLLTEIQNISIFKIVNMSIRFNIKCNISEEMVMNHIEVQQRVQSRIEEINSYIEKTDKDKNGKMYEIINRIKNIIHKNEKYKKIEIREIKTTDEYGKLKKEVNEKLPNTDKEIMNVYNKIREETCKKEEKLSNHLPAGFFVLSGVVGILTTIILARFFDAIDKNILSGILTQENFTQEIFTVELIIPELIILAAIIFMVTLVTLGTKSSIKNINKRIYFYKMVKFILENSSKNETTEEADLNKNNI